MHKKKPILGSSIDFKESFKTWLLHGKCTCTSKANRHFIIYKVAKKILMYKNLPPQVFWQPMAK